MRRPRTLRGDRLGAEDPESVCGRLLDSTGDPRPARRPRPCRRLRRCWRDEAWTSRRSPTTSASSGRATPSTATTRPTSRSARRRRPGSPPRELAGWLAEELAGKDGIASAEIAGPGLHQPAPRRRRAGRHRRRGARGAARPTATATSTPAATSTWSSSRPTRRARCTWAAPAGPRSATRSAGCSPRGAPRSSASTTSTTPAAQIDRFVRSLVAAAHGEPTPEDGYGGAYIGEIAARVVAAEPDALSSPRPRRDRSAGSASA